MAFGLSVLNRVYNFIRVYPKQDFITSDPALNRAWLNDFRLKIDLSVFNYPSYPKQGRYFGIFCPKQGPGTPCALSGTPIQSTLALRTPR